MSEPILDCHHNDVTAIVEAREMQRLLRKWINRTRYHRRYARGRR
jgi:hypothetical protein